LDALTIHAPARPRERDRLVKRAPFERPVPGAFEKPTRSRLHPGSAQDVDGPRSPAKSRHPRKPRQRVERLELEPHPFLVVAPVSEAAIDSVRPNPIARASLRQQQAIGGPLEAALDLVTAGAEHVLAVGGGIANVLGLPANSLSVKTGRPSASA
jgi:hypothetical protein